MRVVLFVILLGMASARPGASQPVAEGFLPYSCDTVARQARTYLAGHGLNASARASWRSFRGLTIHLPDSTMPFPWTDATGRRVSDFKIFWRYSNRRTGDKRRFAAWRIRMSPYHPEGALELNDAPGGCRIDFHLSFETGGAHMLAVVPRDSQWGYASNGRLERGYLDAIAADLKHKFAPADRP